MLFFILNDHPRSSPRPQANPLAVPFLGFPCAPLLFTPPLCHLIDGGKSTVSATASRERPAAPRLAVVWWISDLEKGFRAIIRLAQKKAHFGEGHLPADGRHPCTGQVAVKHWVIVEQEEVSKVADVGLRLSKRNA